MREQRNRDWRGGRREEDRKTRFVISMMGVKMTKYYRDKWKMKQNYWGSYSKVGVAALKKYLTDLREMKQQTALRLGVR